MKPSTLPKYLSGLIALGSYLLLVALFVYYFNTHHTRKAPTHYVKKDQKVVTVSLMASPPALVTKPKPLPPKKPKPLPPKKKVVKKKLIKKKLVTKKPIKKKPIKKKPIKKVTPKKAIRSKEENRTRQAKRIEALFDQLTTPPKKVNRVSTKQQTQVPQSRQARDSGVENSYLAKVEQLLEGWPAQSEYAGECATVHLRISPTGRFTFTLKRASSNEAFNTGLIAYLKQLQGIGFGSHKGTRSYQFAVEFIAKE